MIVKCTCKHVYQDRVYGLGMRVANEAKGPSPGQVVHRCVVCKKEHVWTVQAKG